MQLAGGVDHLQREGVFVAPYAADLLAVAGLRHDRHGSAAAFAPAAARDGRARSGDLLADRRRVEPAGVRQVGSDDPAPPVDLVAGGAVRGAAEEHRFSGGRSAGCRRRSARRGTGCRGRFLQAADVGHQLPRLLIAQRRVGRHLRAGDAGPDRAEEVGVAVAVLEAARRQRRGAALAVPLRADAVARLAGRGKRALAFSRRGRVVGQRIDDGVGHLCLLREDAERGDNDERDDERDTALDQGLSRGCGPSYDRPIESESKPLDR